VFDGVTAFDAGAVFESAAGAVFAFALLLFASAAGAVSAGVSGLLESTETLPLSAGIESSNAVIIKTVAVTIVIFERTVAVPRGPNALLEMLLVKSAPASVLPG
jgi:hypothetical protein